MAKCFERIKEALILRNIKQTELSNLTGIDKGTISHYVAGDFRPKQENLSEIAKVLNVSEEWLMGRDVPMERIESKNLILGDDLKEMIKNVSTKVNSECSAQTAEFIKLYEALSAEKRMLVISVMKGFLEEI